MKKLPAGYAHEWTGLSFQERLTGSQTLYLYAISPLIVFLCLAALYESWSIPFAVMLVRADRHPRSAGGGDDVRAGQRRLFPGRSADDDRPVREERDSDRGIRDRAASGRQGLVEATLHACTAAPAADPDDFAGLCSRRTAPGGGDRRRLGQPERHRHRRRGRHGHRDGARASSSCRCFMCWCSACFRAARRTRRATHRSTQWHRPRSSRVMPDIPPGL
jgi:hypothetical protein